MKTKKLIAELAAAREALEAERRRNPELRESLEIAERKIRVLTVENEQLAAVCARDRARVHAEAAESAGRIAAAEGTK
jgi:hypothetical protein